MSGALLERIEAMWASPALGMWAMVAAAVIVAIVLFVIVLKADRSLANGALAIITLLALGVASAALMRDKPAATAAASAVPGMAVGQSALACLDGLAGERVETVCEKALFASANSTAAAVSYTAAQISRLPAVVAQAGPELGQMRRVLERDRYGLVAQVLTVREGCTPEACETYRYLVNTSQISANMTGRAFETLVARYADAWGDAPQMASAPPAAAPVSAAPRPTTIEFPTSASIPQVDIMSSPEPRRGSEPPPIVTVTQPPAAPPRAAAVAPAPQPHQPRRLRRSQPLLPRRCRAASPIRRPLCISSRSRCSFRRPLSSPPHRHPRRNRHRMLRRSPSVPRPPSVRPRPVRRRRSSLCRRLPRLKKNSPARTHAPASRQALRRRGFDQGS